jgi:hemerythrin-like domain-containing protein
VFLGLAAAVLNMWRDWGFWPFIPAALIFIYLVVANRIAVRINKHREHARAVVDDLIADRERAALAAGRRSASRASKSSRSARRAARAAGRRGQAPIWALYEQGRDDAVPSSRGMKRHPALIPLSRDHHDGLVQAVRLRRAAADGDASARLAAAREFVEFFRNEERVHLRGEEDELFPLFLKHVQSQPAPLRQARVQHMQLEGFARKLEIAAAAGIADRETLAAAGELLEAHIRLEERQLFPLIEELVPDDELRSLGLASRDVTCAVRRPPLTS